MLEWIKDIFVEADLWTVVFTLTTIVIASIKNWFVAEQRLRTTFYLMIFLGGAYMALNTHIALNNKGQEILMLMNIPAIWTTLMGIKGLKKLKQ